MQQQHAADAALLQRHLLLLSALVQPEPSPKPWHLNLRTEALKYFITELDMEDMDLGTDGTSAVSLDNHQRCQPQAKLLTHGLGLGSAVPRFLRWDQSVELKDCSVQETELQVGDVLSMGRARLLVTDACQALQQTLGSMVRGAVLFVSCAHCSDSEGLTTDSRGRVPKA